MLIIISKHPCDSSCTAMLCSWCVTRATALFPKNHFRKKSRKKGLFSPFFLSDDSCNEQKSSCLVESDSHSHSLIISVRMDPRSVNGTEGPCRSPLWTHHTVPLLLINEQLSPSPLMTANDAVGSSPSAAQRWRGHRGTLTSRLQNDCPGPL